MASALSEDEFHRLQLQLIELKTHNYQLNDKCRVQDTELNQIKSKFDAAEKDLQRANKALSKNKKAKEWELVLQDNEQLQQKLQTQEEEFRLQNETLMRELSLLIANNEQLEQQAKSTPLTSLQRVAGGSGSCDSALESELRRLQAEKAVLQRNLDESQHAFTADKMRSKASTDDGDITDDAADFDFADSVGPLPNQSHKKPGHFAHHQVPCDPKPYNDFKVQLETEKEENRLLKDKLSAFELKVDELSEKLRKKQEAFSQFQSDNEQLLAEARKKVEYLEEARQRDSRNQRNQTDRLQDEIGASRKESEAFKSTSLQYIAKLEAMVKTLEAQVSECSPAYVELRKQELETARADNESLRAQLAQSLQRLDSVSQMLKEHEARAVSLDSLARETAGKLDMQTQTTQDAMKLAEKRKSLLDELAMKAVEDDDRHKKKVKDLEAARQHELTALRDAHRTELESMSLSLDDAQEKLEDYEKCRHDLAALTQQVQLLEQAKDWLQRRVKEAEGAVTQLENQHSLEMLDVVKSHEDEVSSLKASHNKEVEELQAKFCGSSEESVGLRSEVAKLQQEIKDVMSEMRLHEKKGASLLKDLKKQVGIERSRAERLEQRLQEGLTDSKTARSYSEDFVLPPPIAELSNKDETSSVSSWTSHTTGGLSGTIKEASSTALAQHESTLRSSPVLAAGVAMMATDTRRVAADTAALVDELTHAKRVLEEKVSILEQSSAAMADDLIQKQAIIEHYITDSKEYVSAKPSEEKITLKRVFDFVKDRGDESLKEKYRIAQRMLEETLTKNMGLQKDMDILSLEMAKLQSKG